MQLVRYTKISYGTRNAQTYEERGKCYCMDGMYLGLLPLGDNDSKKNVDPSVPLGPFGTEDQKW